MSTYTGQVCDDLIEKTSSLELAADPNWEKGIREKIPSEYADRVKLVVGYSEKGRQVILWGIPGEQQARDLHFYLLQCCTEMKCSSHFNPGALARLDPRFQTTGWVVVTREE